MAKILMIPVTFAITGVVLVCAAAPFLAVGVSFIKGFMG